MLQTGPTAKTLSVLVVEDDPGDQHLIRRALDDNGAIGRIEMVRSGEEALAWLRESAWKPHLVILDLNLPGLDGWDVLDRIKSDPQLSPIPVVVLTTSRNQDDVTRAYEKHANSYSVKPGDLDAFMELVRSIRRYWADVSVCPPR